MYGAAVTKGFIRCQAENWAGLLLVVQLVACVAPKTLTGPALTQQSSNVIRNITGQPPVAASRDLIHCHTATSISPSNSNPHCILAIFCTHWPILYITHHRFIASNTDLTSNLAGQTKRCFSGTALKSPVTIHTAGSHVHNVQPGVQHKYYTIQSSQKRFPNSARWRTYKI